MVEGVTSSADLLANLKCDTCGEPAVGVASSAVGPMSLAYCAGCLSRNSMSLFEASYLYDFVSTDGEGLAEWVQATEIFKDGGWITWPEFVKERWRGPVCLVHRVHCREWLCDLCGYEEACTGLPPMEGCEEFPGEVVIQK